MRQSGYGRSGSRRDKSSRTVVCASQQELAQTRMGNWIGRETPLLEYGDYKEEDSFDSHNGKENRGRSSSSRSRSISRARSRSRDRQSVRDNGYDSGRGRSGYYDDDGYDDEHGDERGDGRGDGRGDAGDDGYDDGYDDGGGKPRAHGRSAPRESIDEEEDKN